MKKDKTDEKCLRCRYHKLNKEYPLVLNEHARWVVGIHCINHGMYEEPYIIPSTKGMRCNLFMEMMKP